ncbi:hypothetical protein M9458_049680, partial [Cirrhinus mrigala]
VLIFEALPRSGSRLNPSTRWPYVASPLDALVRVEWKKDGTFLNLVADDRKRQLGDGSLLISTVVHSKHNKPDEGVYQCVATIDNLGTISSRTARLTVA